MGISSMLADAKGKYKHVLLISLVFFALAFALFGLFDNVTIAFIGVVLFFVGFNMLEPMMQSLITKYAKAHERGTVLGLFNGFGFLGSALGGMLGGVGIMQGFLNDMTYIVIGLTIILLIMALKMHNPARLKNLYLPQESVDESILTSLEKEAKIVEWYKNDNEKLLIVKYDDQHLNEAELRTLLG